MSLIVVVKDKKLKINVMLVTDKTSKKLSNQIKCTFNIPAGIQEGNVFGKFLVKEILFL
ncbi:hypothetical protein ACEW7V_00555 [Areca yellow leaf disease phytoplasma]|uniref:hypothetical protein n=1 Tax=Areca yellow leaf disease phytoplasma TaxID=927614 RepID=UPI0035B54A79